MSLTKVKGSGLATGAATDNLVGIDDNATSTAITIDASENTFIAKTAIGIGTVGHELRADGLHRATRAGSYPLELNRTTSYGDQIRFDKDGTVSGSIVSHAPSEFGISSEQTLVLTQKVSAERNLVFGASYFGPFGVDNGAIDLGRSNAKFKDLHLSGNVVVASGKGIDFSATSDGSGTMTSEVLDDYEEGTFTCSAGLGTLNSVHGTYTKIGRTVTVQCNVNTFSNTTHTTEQVSVWGLPFTASADAKVGSLLYGNISISGTGLAAFVYPSNSLFRFYNMGDNTSSSTLKHSALTSSSYLYITATYETA